MLITVPEAAAVLGLDSPGDLYRKVKAGRLPGAAQYPKKNGMLQWMVEREGLEDAWAKVNRRKGRPVVIRGAEPPAAPAMKPEGRGPVPDYDDSRARHEFEKANLAELERKRREGELIERETVGRSLAKLMSILRTELLGLPSTLRDRVPHLTAAEIEVAEDLIRRSLDDLASGMKSDGLPSEPWQGLAREGGSPPSSHKRERP